MPFNALSCPICYSEYNDAECLPRIIPTCGHTVCTKCLIILLSNSESAKCPLDNARFNTSHATIDSFPINFTLKQLFEEKSIKKVCPEHNEKLRLICVTDKCEICDDCVFLGDHKGHDVKPFKKIKQEVTQKRQELETLQKILDRHNREVTDMLEQRRMALNQVIKDKFQELRWVLTKKELELSFAANSMFEKERGTTTRNLGVDMDYINTLLKKTADLDEIVISEDIFSLLEQDIPNIAAKIPSNLLDEQAQTLNQKFNDISNEVFETLINQTDSVAQVKFPIKDASISHIEEAYSNQDNNTRKTPENLISPRLNKLFRFEEKDGWLVIATQDNPSGYVSPNNIGSKPTEWKNFDKIWLKFGKCEYMDECVGTLINIWKALGDVSSIKADFISSNISDKGLLSALSVIFEKPQELQTIAVDLCDCRVGDQSVIPLVEELLPKMDKLKNVALNLNSTQITDKTVEAFAKRMLPVIRNLEGFDLRLWETKVTDKSVSQLFTKMEKVKRFTLDLGYTGVSNESILTFATITVPTMKVLEEFKLGLSQTHVSDESVAEIFGSMETVKNFLLYLHGTNISDKSLKVFAEETLLTFKALEVFEMRLGETKVSDQGIIRLFNNMENVKKFVLKLQSTSISDKTVETFIKTTLPGMKVMDEFEMDVANTDVSEKNATQLNRIKEKVSE